MAESRETVVLEFRAEASQLTATLTESNELLADQTQLLDKNGKKVSAVGNNFQKTGDQIAKTTLQTSAGMKAVTAQTEQVAKAFGHVKDEATAVEKKALTLKAQYKQAMIDVQNGVEGAAEKAGELKDAIDDANEAVKNLATGSKLEAFSNQLGTVSGKIASLDFGGAADAARQLQTISSSISFKETIGQFKDLGSAAADLGASVLTNPFFLSAAAIATITVVLYKLITAEEEELTTLRKITAANEVRFANEIAGLDRVIALERAKGNNTDALEAKKLIKVRESIKSQIKLQEALVKQEENAAEIRDQVFGKNVTSIVLKQQTTRIVGETETQKKLNELKQKELDAVNEIEVQKATVIKTAQDKAKTDYEEFVSAKEKADEAAAKKREELRKAELEEIQFQKEQEAEILRLEKERQDLANKEHEKFVKNFKKENEFKGAALEDDEENLKLIEQLSKGSLDKRKIFLDSFLEQGRISQETYYEEIDKLRQEDLKKDLDSANQKISNAQYFLNAGMAINEAINQIQLNQLKKGEQLSIAQQEAQFQRQKALSITNALINGAQAVTKGIAEFGPPPSPLGIAAIASAGIITGLQVAAIASKQFQPQGLFEGTPFVELKGSRKGKDTVPAMLNEGERVVTTDQNRKYWDVLESIRLNKFDKEYVNLGNIRAANEAIREGENESFASNVASAMLLNGVWKGKNITDMMHNLNLEENKRHKQLVGVLKNSHNRSLRNKW